MRKQRNARLDEPVFSIPPLTAVQPGPTSTRNWNTLLRNVPDLWREIKGQGIKIAILDTGIDDQHPALSSNIKKCRNFTDDASCRDENGHGTIVAGVIAANGWNGRVTGIAPTAELYIGKVIKNGIEGKGADLLSGISWALEMRVDIINISVGDEASVVEVERALAKAIAENIMVICAAGNRGPEGLDFPANYHPCLAIGAVNFINDRLELSAVGEELDFVAYGDQVTSTYPMDKDPSGTTTKSGTSLAAPLVTGVAALALAKHRLRGGATPIDNQQQLLEHLRRIAIDLPPQDFDKNTGYGLIKRPDVPPSA